MSVSTYIIATVEQISCGDIFSGAPAADAIVSECVLASRSDLTTSLCTLQVSPANSFGFMDGGIDMAYSQHFGWQM